MLNGCGMKTSSS